MNGPIGPCGEESAGVSENFWSEKQTELAKGGRRIKVKETNELLTAVGKEIRAGESQKGTS